MRGPAGTPHTKGCLTSTIHRDLFSPGRRTSSTSAQVRIKKDEPSGLVPWISTRARGRAMARMPVRWLAGQHLWINLRQTTTTLRRWPKLFYLGQDYHPLEGSKDSLTYPSNLYNASRRSCLSDTVSHTYADICLMHTSTSNGHIFAVIRRILDLFRAMAALECKETL